MNSRTHTTRVTISLPAAMVKAADRQSRLELRNRSEMMREALRYYLSRVPVGEATSAEIAALKRGKDEIARGDYVSLTNLRYDMDGRRHKERTKRAR